ncbi:MAG: phosphatase PAP2 family protein [Gemmatimonadota bacterium]
MRLVARFVVRFTTLPVAAVLLVLSAPGASLMAQDVGEPEPNNAGRRVLAAARQPAVEEEFLRLQWWHPFVAGAGIAAVFLVDEPVQEFMQDHQSGFRDDVADVAKQFHKPNVFLVAGAGSMALGLVAREPKLAEAGVQIVTAYGLSSGMMLATKWAFGRTRPSETPDEVTDFDWFGGGSSSSFPSGAAAVSFSLATTIADAVDRTPVTIAVYTLATLNSWARVYADRHWLSDVALGALYGVTAAKIVNGNWRVFGLRPPTVGIAADGGVGVSYSIRH